MSSFLWITGILFAHTRLGGGGDGQTGGGEGVFWWKSWRCSGKRPPGAFFVCCETTGVQPTRSWLPVGPMVAIPSQQTAYSRYVATQPGKQACEQG